MRLVFFLMAAAAAAQTPDYFPLHPGDQWVYRSRGAVASTKVVEVGESREMNGQVWFLVTGFSPAPVWLRRSGDRFVALDGATGRELTMLDFGAAQPFDSAVDPCSPKASVGSKTAHYEGPVGMFDSAIEITYALGPCRDAGLERDLYLPWIGLVQRTETTIAGPRTWDLIYSVTGGVTVVSEPHTSFGVSSDRAAYTPGAAMTLRATYQGTGSLTFANPLEIYYRIRSEDGTLIWDSSAGQIVIQVLHSTPINREKNWAAIATAPTAPGRYTLEAQLATTPQQYRAVFTFEVR